MNQTVEQHFLELLETDSSRAIADIIIGEVGDNPEYFKILFEYCLTKPYPVSMRSARALQFCVENHKNLINPFLDKIVNFTINTKVEGVRRSFLKVISELPDIINLNDSGFLINQCFEWIVSQNENPAIKVYSIDVIYNACKAEPLLRNELISVLDLVREDSSIAVRTRVKKILGSI
jgi:hypothetical protein